MGAFLRSFTDGPVLPIDQVPEVDRVAGVEVWLLHPARIEVPIAFNRGVRRASGPESMDHEIVRMKTEEHVREDEVIVDAVPIFLRHPLQGRPLRVARPHHRRVVLRELHEAAVEIAGSRLPCEICCVGPGRVVRDPVQVRVDRGAVIALGIVLPEDFPIRLDLVGLAGPEAEILELESPKPGKELTHLFGEVRCPIVQIRPDESAPGADSERAKAVILLPEIHERLRVGRPDEPSLNRIGPCVVGADEGSELLSCINADDARPSVPAHVVESADLAVFPPDEQERLVSDLPHEKIPRVRNLIRATDVQPAAKIEPLELFAERRLVPEGFPRQQGRGREVLSGLDVRTSFRNLGLLHPFRSRYSEDSFGVFATIKDAVDVEAAIVRCCSLRGSTRAVALARGSPAFPPTMAEALLFGSGILRRPFLPFLHPSRNAVVAKTVVVQTHLNRSFSVAVGGPSCGERKRTSVSLSRMTEYRPRCGRGRARRMPANPFVPSCRAPRSRGVR